MKKLIATFAAVATLAMTTSAFAYVVVPTCGYVTVWTIYGPVVQYVCD